MEPGSSKVELAWPLAVAWEASVTSAAADASATEEDSNLENAEYVAIEPPTRREEMRTARVYSVASAKSS